MWLWSDVYDGNEGAFQEFAADFGAKFACRLRRHQFSEADAHEVAWDATVHVLLNRTQFRPEEPAQQKFLAWAWRVAANYAESWRRSRRPGIYVSLDETTNEFVAAEPAPLDAQEVRRRIEMEAEARESRLRALVDQLSPKLKETVLLKDFDGQATFSQVAETLGISETAARVRYHRALRRLREIASERKP